MESKAIAKFQRVSPRKTRLVAQNVKGLPVEEALNQLKFTPNKPAGVLYGVVRSALANAAQFPGIDVDSMYVKDVVVATADKIIKDAGIDMKYEVGTMIEIPRAALTADEIAKEAEFFSFGTNDLTQMTFGFSRDDAAKFLGAYYENKIYESDPFQHLDQVGVGKLVKMAAHDGRETRPDLGLGICGEHGGDPTSVEFCHNVGLDYVSCSPFRVPIARLAAAQAAIKHPRAN